MLSPRWTATLLSIVAIFGCEPSNTRKGEPATPMPTTSVTGPELPAPEPAALVDAGSTPDASDSSLPLFVRAFRADCEGGAGPMKCLQVREHEADPWRLFYGRIEGFSYEESFAYELRVATETVRHPPADGSSKRYRLVEIVAKAKPSAPHD